MIPTHVQESHICGLLRVPVHRPEYVGLAGLVQVQRAHERHPGVLLSGLGGAASAHGGGGGVVDCTLEGDELEDEKGEDGEGEEVSDKGVCGCGEGV